MGDTPVNRIELNEGQDYLEWQHTHGGNVEITDIAVSSERRKGYGKLLVKMLIDLVSERAHMIWVITRTSNTTAGCFYSSQGFRVLAILLEFYPEGDAVVYGKKLYI